MQAAVNSVPRCLVTAPAAPATASASTSASAGANATASGDNTKGEQHQGTAGSQVVLWVCSDAQVGRAARGTRLSVRSVFDRLLLHMQTPVAATTLMLRKPSLPT